MKCHEQDRQTPVHMRAVHGEHRRTVLSDDMISSPFPSSSLVEASDRAKSKFSLGHLRRAKALKCSLFNRRKNFEETLAELPGATRHAWTRDELEKAALMHRDSFKAKPDRATLARMHPRPTDYKVFGAAVNVLARPFYDRQGRLEIHINSRMRTMSPSEAGVSNQRLHPAHRAALFQLRNRLESQTRYSTTAPALALCRSVRLSRRQGQSQFGFREALQWLNISGTHLIDDYEGGTCMPIADALANAIKRRFGLQAFVVAQPADNLLVRWPALDRKGSDGNVAAFDHLDGDTHTNVVVPYRSANNEHRHLRIVCGTGPCKNMQDGIYDLSDADVAHQFIQNPGRITAEAVGCAFKLNIRDPMSGRGAGIDLLRGKLYVNARMVGAEGPGRGMEVNIAEVQTGEGQGAIGDPSCEHLIGLILEVFGFSHEAGLDLRFLIDHADEFCDTVLVRPASTLRRCIHIRDEAVEYLQTVQEARALAHSETPLAQTKGVVADKVEHAQQFLSAAAKAVNAGDSHMAAQQYSRALEELKTCLTLIGGAPLSRRMTLTGRR